MSPFNFVKRKLSARGFCCREVGTEQGSDRLLPLKGGKSPGGKQHHTRAPVDHFLLQLLLIGEKGSRGGKKKEGVYLQFGGIERGGEASLILEH